MHSRVSADVLYSAPFVINMGIWVEKGRIGGTGMVFLSSIRF